MIPSTAKPVMRTSAARTQTMSSNNQDGPKILADKRMKVKATHTIRSDII